MWHRSIVLLVAVFITSVASAQLTGAKLSSRLQAIINDTKGVSTQQDKLFTVIIESTPLVSHGIMREHGAVLRYRRDNLQEVQIPAAKLERFLRDLPSSVIARLPYPHIPAAVTSQGVTLTGAGDMHALDNVASGITVGVIDIGFTSVAASQTAGELPDNLTLVDYTGNGTGGGTHGTNVAEVVHDMAPSAALFLARIGTETQLSQAVEDMLAAGVDVIVHSVVWFGASFYDGTGPLCDITDNADSGGIQWVNAIGNHRHRHYLAEFGDVDGDLHHDFSSGQNYNTVNVASGATIRLVLNWDAYPQTKVDYDLLLYDGVPDPGKLPVASSSNRQSANGPFWFPIPYESLDYTAVSSGTYYIVVRKVDAGTVNLRFTLFSLNHGLAVGTQASSLVQPADCLTVLGVGAVNLLDAPEVVSSLGPTTDGRNKPEIVAPTRVQTSLTSSFFGTSAAAPHVGGAVALLMAQNPGLSLLQLRSMLTGTALDIHTSGYDFVTGYGRISLDADIDGANHDSDNCTVITNPDQRDTNGDGYGNLCDGDLNNDGGTNTLDLQLYAGVYRSRLGDPNYDPDADFNGDDRINTLDLNIFSTLYRKPPGPSCCGS